MQPIKQHVSILIALWRVIKLFLHFMIGAISVFFFIRFLSEVKKAKRLRNWSYRLMKILDISLVVEGDIPKQLGNTLIVANHISWLDILVLFTVINPRFVAKKEIGNWPIIGWLTKLGGTVFIERANKRNIVLVNEQLSKELTTGNYIAVFPEGTTSDGLAVQNFRASLFEPICCSKGYVLPVALQYLDVQGNMTIRPAFVGNMSFLRSVWNVLTCYKLTIRVILNDILNSQQFIDRSQLALKSQQVINKHWVADDRARKETG